MKTLGLINARGGSKRIPRKNIQMISGKPMIFYPIKAGLDSKLIDKVVVSTDDTEIAEIAKDCGACVPFIRSKELAGDNVTQFPPTEHAILELQKQGEYFDIVVLILANAPFVTGKNIDDAISMITNNTGIDSVRSICDVSTPPEWMCILKDDNIIERYKSDIPIGDSRFAISQNLPSVYELVGIVDVVKVDTVLDKNSLFGDRVKGIVFSRFNSFDIDTMYDLYIARLIMRDKVDRCNNWFKYYIKPEEID